MTHDHNRAWALRLAEAGISVFPCNPNPESEYFKKPAIKDWDGTSSCDPAKVAQMWAERPGFMPAIDLRKCGLIVLDGDRHHEGVDGRTGLRNLLRQAGFDPSSTPCAITPRDGVHVYFQQNGHRLGNRRGDLPEGIDVRGDGGYVIAPYAAPASGESYRALPKTPDLITAFTAKAIAPIPKAIACLLAAKQQNSDGAAHENKQHETNNQSGGDRERAYAAAALNNLTNELAATGKGDRNAALNTAALKLGHMIVRGWISRSEVEQALIGAMETNGYIADDGMHAALATLRSGIEAGMTEPHGDIKDRPYEEKRSTGGGGSNNNEGSAQPGIDLASAFSFLGDEPATPPQELIKGLLPAHGVAITGGQSTAGKTFIEIHKSICLATTLPFFGHQIVEPVGTVFVAAEGRSLINNRFEAAKAREGITDKLPIAWIKLLPDLSSSDGTKLFVQQLKAMDERFRGDFGMRLGRFVVDTVAATFGMKDEDDNAEATQVCNRLRSIYEETGALADAVHHYGKNPESGLRGASAWKGSADVVMGVLADIDPLSGATSNRELVFNKARDGVQGPLSPFELKFVKLGLDQYGEDYGSCCVVPIEGQSRFNKTARLNKGDRTLLDAFGECMNGLSKMITPRAGMEPVRAVRVTDLRQEFDRRYVAGETDPAKAAETKRKAFKRAIDRLAPSQFGAGAAEGVDWIWRTK